MKFTRLLLAALPLIAAPLPVLADDIRIALRDDAGTLDPATNASFVGRISLQSICDKLVDIDVGGNLVPMLAESWEWNEDGTLVTLHIRPDALFHDGTPVDAEAVRFSLDRFLNFPGSRRASELAVIESIEVVDDLTVALHLAAPSVSLLAQFTDRAGMIMSPTGYEALGPEQFGITPVCAGPYRVVQYNPQQDIVLEKFEDHWRADEYHFDAVTFFALSDSNVRLLNLRSGDVDMAEYVAPQDIEGLESDPNFTVAVGDAPAFEGINFNLNGPGADADVAAHPEILEAISLAIDRQAINDVVLAGRYTVGNQFHPPASQWYNTDYPVEGRDIEAARAIMDELGLDNVTISILTSQSPERLAVAEVVQAMVSEIGVTIDIQPIEFIAMREQTSEGNFEAYMTGTAGRVDPDLQYSLLIACDAVNNVGSYCNPEVENLLEQGRATSDTGERKAIYDRLAEILLTDLPHLVLYNPRGAVAMSSDIIGFEAFPDNIIRLEGVQRQ